VAALLALVDAINSFRVTLEAAWSEEWPSSWDFLDFLPPFMSFLGVFVLLAGISVVERGRNALEML
jgi:uncharacterized BrkB/YihY/UPF0761 family membrane protein